MLIKSGLTRPVCPSGRQRCSACSSGIELYLHYVKDGLLSHLQPMFFN